MRPRRAQRPEAPRADDPDGAGPDTGGTTQPLATRPPGRLHVVATPIGTLSDFSPRAQSVLRTAALILAEDTRQTRKLLVHFGITTAMRAFHEHNEDAATAAVVARIRGGDDVALVSDAGTPLLSDPGYRLVCACRAQGVPVLAVPGPSAVTAALSVAGLPPYPFTFAGFAPARAGARATWLARLAGLDHTLVLFLSPHRLAAELQACAATLGSERPAALLAELSKMHERWAGGTLADLAVRAGKEPPRGEYTLVVGPPVAASREATHADARRELQRALDRGLELPAARRAAAQVLGISRRQLYAILTPPER